MVTIKQAASEFPAKRRIAVTGVSRTAEGAQAGLIASVPAGPADPSHFAGGGATPGHSRVAGVGPGPAEPRRRGWGTGQAGAHR
jgi:hypothetical protein